ncbi:MAG: carboxylating nicotinate-nucleotide diphosphorylase [Pseudomonadota bacterium]|uniref:Probable nicotinate-nucleotide pyrophosphorylase [carboxylating] n=1 Tax=Candidatus Desulfatibia profunda TaxID=2841695 RepID=A0A8J6NMF3_9BACT|nr:carboxylating nicotinate-nucleotide diphosphorylase [Candidatus Desulfatibia profunda]MBL7180641.1 carboxylating nicotinate-nucleotide diphosphorylase [Desulfobacterales bacterium]
MHSIRHLIDIALQEDIGPGDITTESLIAPERSGIGKILAKEPLVIAGLDVAEQVFERLDPKVAFKSEYRDGDAAGVGAVVAHVEGKLRALLMGERTALNFLQRLSGIASHVRSYVNALGHSKVRLVDTRKTTPGWRVLEKYAVRVGGAYNHRMGLYDGVLIKDNHVAVCGGVKNAIERIRKHATHLLKIEVEVSDLDQLKEALDAAADVIMLDNMDIHQIREALKLIGGKAAVEVSGGITQSSLKQLADAGVDIISVGALTHAARCMDLSMRIEAKE